MPMYDAQQIKQMVSSLAYVYGVSIAEFVITRESALVMHGIKEKCYDVSIVLSPVIFNVVTNEFPCKLDTIKLPGSVTVYKELVNGKEVFIDERCVQSLEDLLNYYMSVSHEECASDMSVDDTILAIENEMERLSNVSSNDALRYCDHLADEAMCLIVQNEMSGILSKLKQSHTTVITDAAKRRWSVTFKPAQKMIELFEVDGFDIQGNVDIHQITIGKVNRRI